MLADISQSFPDSFLVSFEEIPQQLRSILSPTNEPGIGTKLKQAVTINFLD